MPEETTRARQMMAYVESLLTTGLYPQLSLLAGTLGMQKAWDQIQHQSEDAGRFERNLKRLLDGVESDLRTR